MVDVSVEFELGQEQPIEAEFEIQPDVTYKADLEIATFTKDHEKLFNRDKENQHPIGAISGLQDVLDRLWTFTFEQSMASDTWEIEHNLGRNPSVVIVDSAGNVFYPAVQYINENKVVVTMNGATTGKAYLN